MAQNWKTALWGGKMAEGRQEEGIDEDGIEGECAGLGEEDGPPKQKVERKGQRDRDAAKRPGDARQFDVQQLWQCAAQQGDDCHVAQRDQAQSRHCSSCVWRCASRAVQLW